VIFMIQVNDKEASIQELKVREARRTSHVARHTSHVTRRTSHVTRHTSHVTRRTSHVARRTSRVALHTCEFDANQQLSQQLERLKGEYAAKVQEYETVKAANEDFANKEKQMTTELTATKKAADKVSTELESTKGKLEKASAKGKEIESQLSQSQKEHDAAVKSGSALSQQLERLKGDYAAKAQEYECTIKKAERKCKSATYLIITLSHTFFQMTLSNKPSVWPQLCRQRLGQRGWPKLANAWQNQLI
jgi:chromosome segregation ATPase